MLGWIGAFFSRHAWLSLFTLLVLMGLVGGLFKLGGSMPKGSAAAPTPVQAGQPSQTRSFGAATQNTSCGQVLASFSASATVQQITGLLRSLDTVISYGPNENGAFELRTSPALAAQVALALETSPLVTLATAQPQCR
jgi:hypothetical protein